MEASDQEGVEAGPNLTESKVIGALSFLPTPKVFDYSKMES